jgi:Ca2+-binding RTX toxin-like protein
MPNHATRRLSRLRFDSLEDRATPAVTTSFDAVAGRLIVRSDSGDPISVSAAGPLAAPVVTVNGRRLTVAAASVQTLDVRGGPGNNIISLVGVTPAAFPALTRVQADAGAGRDTVTGSAIADDILGGPGNDILRGLAGNDTLRGGGGIDVLEGGAGDDLLKSSDPVEAGFNDTSGLNADPTPDSPYQVGGILFGHGQGEPGWAGGWQQPLGALGNSVVQSDVVFEGDAALKVSGGTTALYRDWSAAEPAGVVTVSQMIYIPAGGGTLEYVQDGAIGDPAVATAAQWMAAASGTFQVVDGGAVEDTGIPVPVQQWIRVDVRVDMTARTYEFFVDGVKFNAPDPLDFRGNPGALSRVTFLLENVPGFYVDALQVDGPDAPVPMAKGDTLRGGPGADTLRGASGPDVLVGAAGNDSISGGTGNDTLFGGADQDDLSGDDGNDRLLGQTGTDTLSGGRGADALFGGWDGDSLAGGQGNDTLDGGLGFDRLDGEAGRDSLVGGPGDDTLDGGSGDDRLAGQAGMDLLRGGGGGDWLSGGLGDDHLESADPALPAPVSAGFNDGEGINADPTADSPYAIGGQLAGTGVGEPGWASEWVAGVGPANATVQNATVFEGDGAIQITGGTTQILRQWSDGEATGIVTVSEEIYIPAGGGLGQYVQDSAFSDAAVSTAAQWDAIASLGNFRVVDGGVVEDTGIPVPIQQWVKVAVRIDMTARTYDFFVNDVQYIAPDPIDFRGNPGVVNQVNFLVENAPGGYIDAIQVLGPDPAGNPTTFGDTLDGGAGTDVIHGDRGNDLLLGSAGNDSLYGGFGRDLMIGGLGADNLIGDDDQDILIGGRTVYDLNVPALSAILAEWTSARDAPTRHDNIAGTGTGPQLNGVYVLNRRTVITDGFADGLNGLADIDWFFARPGEDTTDLSAEDFATNL